MKTKKIILIFCFLISSSVFCQVSNNEKFYKDFLLELKQQKVDTICVFEDYSVGSYITFVDTVTDYCTYDSDYFPTYIFWKQNGKTFFTIKDSCYVYSVIQIEADKVWNKYFENKKLINSEEVKMFQFREIDNGINCITSIAVDHTHHQNFKIIINNKTIEKRFDDFQLQKDDGDNRMNINYEHNKNLKSKILVDAISNLTSSNEKFLTKTKKK